MAVKAPHILLASGNARRMIANLETIVDDSVLTILRLRLDDNSREMMALARDHLELAKHLKLEPRRWRHTVSRAYYASYLATRAVRLAYDGSYSTESTDHKKVGVLPTGFPNQATYENQLPILRDDRNLADYDHAATPADLLVGIEPAVTLAAQVISDAQTWLDSRGTA